MALHPEAQALIVKRMQTMAQERGEVFDPDHPDNIHRLNMGVFPVGARIIPNAFNGIAGFYCSSTVGQRSSAAGPPQGERAPLGGSDPHAVGERGGVFFVPGFPVMAWPMIEWVLDTHYAHLFRTAPKLEKSVIVFGAMEASLTPLMLAIESSHPVKVFSLPSVDHPEYGRHVELGVKGEPGQVEVAYGALRQGLESLQATLGPELVR
jgi:molybdopterin-biosynthesis enzyme MoeA-like protein